MENLIVRSIDTGHGNTKFTTQHCKDGGADLFYDEIVKAIPSHTIFKEDDPVFSNVQGFQAVGEMWAKDMAMQAKRKK